MLYMMLINLLIISGYFPPTLFKDDEIFSDVANMLQRNEDMNRLKVFFNGTSIIL